MTLDITTTVKLKAPQKGEESLLYRITNVNEHTGKCYIKVINSPVFKGTILPQELVNLSDICNA